MAHRGHDAVGSQGDRDLEGHGARGLPLSEFLQSLRVQVRGLRPRRSGRLRRRPRGHVAEEGQKLTQVIRRLAPVDHGGAQRSQAVQALEEDVDHIPRRFQFILAYPIEDVLHGVGQGGHLLMTDGRGRSLNRVRGAEKGVDGFRIGTLFEGEETVLEGLDLFVQLFEKELKFLFADVGGYGHQTLTSPAGRAA